MSQKFINIAILIILISSSALTAQGISRSSGVGFRIGTWSKSINDFTFVNIGQEGERFAGSFLFYYFTRFRENWFWEFNFGGIGDVQTVSSLSGATEVTGIVPMTFGLRNDFLTNRNQGKLQPYYSFGAGPYIVGIEENINGTPISESGLKLGIYGGTGINLAFTSWFAFNLDIKYHLMKFAFNNPASGFNLNFGISLMWGQKREIFRIKQTRLIVSDIYPAYYQFYNTYPLALVSVQNTAGYPIEINVRTRVSPFSTRPKDSGFMTINKGETKDIPVTAVFGYEIGQISSREPAVLDIEVEGRAGITHREQVSAQILVHTRNSWNGEIDKLGFFITPDNERVIQLSRGLISQLEDSLKAKQRNLALARSIFNKLSQIGIQYQSDPNIPFYKDDRVQFAEETLTLLSGDCDDLVVLYASLLESLGIKTAFIEVQDPEKTLAHVYLMFDSGISAENAFRVSSNEKRYLIRHLPPNVNSVWIPIETTLVSRGFEEAWKSGALNYLEEARLKNGIMDGWIQIYDIN
jgi:transglutaminase-like putative cysteine protease